MKSVLIAMILALPLTMPLVHAQSAQTEPTAQQSKMKTCNTEATGMKGEERKAFMKECLAGKPKASPAQQAQQDKMKSCNAEAKGMTGDDRKAFMSKCLKK